VQRGIKDYTAKLRSDSEEDTWSNVLVAFVVIELCLSLFFFDRFSSADFVSFNKKTL
jgi:hypothetical protein